jgi:hypothetical protein
MEAEAAMRRLTGSEYQDVRLISNGACACCGFSEAGLHGLKGGDAEWAFGALACPECAAALVPPAGDTHFVAILPEMTQAQVSHLARAIATASLGACPGRDARWYLGLVENGFASGAPIADDPDFGFADGDFDFAGLNEDASKSLRTAASAAYAALEDRGRIAAQIFGVSSPAEFADLLASQSPDDRAAVSATARTVPRRIAVKRIESWKHPVG